MWLLLARGYRTGNGIEDVLADLAALERFVADVRRRVEPDGLDGVDGLVARVRAIHAVLDAISLADIERMRADVSALQRALGDVARAMSALALIRRNVAS
jgi:hypothetical protein